MILQLRTVAGSCGNDDILMRSIALGIRVTLHGPYENIVQDRVREQPVVFLALPDVPGKADTDTPVMRQDDRLGPRQKVLDGLVSVRVDVVKQERSTFALLISR